MTRAAEVVSVLVVVLVVLVVAAVLESGGPPHKEKHLPTLDKKRGLAGGSGHMQIKKHSRTLPTLCSPAQQTNHYLS